MRSSNFYLDARLPVLRLLVLTCIASLFGDAAYAVDPSWLMSQYIRDQWGVDQGFPRGEVHAITQTPDGYLWIGTESGLIRFDGSHFLVVRDRTNTFQIQAILGLTADREGNLWIRLRAEGTQTLLRYRNGAFYSPESAFVWSNNRVTATSLGIHGELIASHTQLGEMAYRNGRFELLASGGGLPNSPVLSLAQTQDGSLWVGTRDSGVYRMVHGQSTGAQNGLPDPKINCLLADTDLWAGTDDGVVRWNGQAFTPAGIPEAQNHFQTLAMARDRNGNLWIGTVSKGLLRLNAQGLAALDPNGSTPSEAVTAVFEDREGNIWTGGAGGIQRLRDSAFVSYPPTAGMPPVTSGPIYVDAKNRTWFAPLDGGLYWLENGQPHRFTGGGIGSDVIYSIAGGDDELWLGRQHGGLTHVSFRASSAAAFQTFTEKDGLAQDAVFAVQHGRDDTVWIGTISGGVSKYEHGRFTTYRIPDGLASNTVFSILETIDGTVWFATPRGLSSLSGRAWSTYTVRDGLPSANVNCLFQDSSGLLWVGTTAGLAFFQSGAFQKVSGGPDSIREQILGMAQDRNGSLWLSTATHVLRVNRNKLLSRSLSVTDVREFGLTDGLHGTEGVKRHQSVVSDQSGRIWFSLNAGLAVVDPSRDAHPSVPILAQIQSISANGEDVDMRGAIRIPAGRQRIGFHYAGLGLSVPELVRFRYALDGDNSQWSEPVEDREKEFTHLDPGPYRFRVIASNVDGDWKNSPEASISFEVERAVWQTLWFRIGAALVFGSLIVAAYRLRLHQLTGQLNMRFEERLAERSSIAKELHDTLLQGLLSASMQLHVATDGLPDESPTKPRLQRVLELMGQVVDEGRNAIRGLRSSSSVALDLEQSLSRIQEEFPPNPDNPPLEFHVTVTGHPRPLHPLMRDESYRIAREAVVNAFRHSRATRLDAEVEYSSGELRVVVSDNGCGIDPEVLASGREGHWGLSGMRERAEKIGGQVHVRSSALAGTEVEFSVPGQIAYLHPPRWFKGFSSMRLRGLRLRR